MRKASWIWLLCVPVFCEPLFAWDWIGSSSCASATCHGGTVGRGPAWNHSYSLSRGVDPHATAGATLYSNDSRRIVAGIAPDAKTELAYDIVLRQRCIGCHLTSTPDDASVNLLLDRAKVGEGVSCESCHGAAGAWLKPHLLTGWTGPTRFEPTTGMLDTESLKSRAEGCVRCHVGSRTADGLVRDMNHDMIAAGHPALRFDLLAYHDNMPHHWDDASLVEQQLNSSAIRVRDVGRSVALMAAARLSAERLDAAQKSEGKNDNAAFVPWPELSDFDCFACHQSVSPRAYRLPSNVDGKASLQASEGLPLWNAWYTSAVVTGSDSPLWVFQAKPGNQTKWVAMSTRIATLLNDRAAKEANSPAVEATLRIAEIRADLNKRAPSDWNAAARIYLQLEAAARDLSSEKSTNMLGKQILGSLEKNVAPILRFPSVDNKNIRVKSPERFDPYIFRTTMIRALDTLDKNQP